MVEEINEILRKKKADLTPEGFVMLGFFGPYADGQETHESDMDILFRISDEFIDRNGGMGSMVRIESIRLELEEELLLQVSLADVEALGPDMEKIIMPGVKDV